MSQQADQPNHAMRPAELLRAGARRLALGGVDSAVADARLLLGHVTGMSALQLLTAGPLAGGVRQAYEQLIDRRLAGTPTQHLVGSAPFRYGQVRVGAGVFIPRPETEVVAQAAIDACEGLEAPLVVELCAGSGAISKSICQEVASARVVAVEVSGDAIGYLRENLAATSAQVLHAGLEQLPQLRRELAGQVDVVVANPPYVAITDDLPKVVLADPDVALYAGRDGLDVVRALLPVARWALRPGGTLVVEHGDEQRSAMLKLVSLAGFEAVVDHDDLTGRPRFTTARQG